MKTNFRHIAAETGISRSYVHAVLTARHNNPTLNILKRLGLYFKCKPDLNIIRAEYARLTGFRPATKQTTTDTGISSTPDKIEAAQ